MNEERALILQMLAAGRVTVEQADQLLEALGAASSSGPHEPATGSRRPRRWDEPDERADDFLARLTPRQLIELRDHEVSGAYVQQMRAAGLRDLSVDDLIALHDHGVDAAFVRKMQGAGLDEVTTAQLIELYDHGVDAAFVREMRALGFAHLAPEELIDLRDHGVESDVVREIRGLDRSSWSERESGE